jgi:quinol-cytochrome oxidoreductase complex cytochrome b subunit
MLSQDFVRTHKTAVAIVLFVVFFFFFHYVKPGFAYGTEGEFRPFGVGYRNKTVVPAWIVAIGLAILTYLFVLAYCRS